MCVCLLPQRNVGVAGRLAGLLAGGAGRGEPGRGGQVGTAATSGRRGVSSEGEAAAARPIAGGFPGNAQDQCPPTRPPAFAPSCWLRASSPDGVAAAALATVDNSDFLVVAPMRRHSCRTDECRSLRNPPSGFTYFD